jgi:diacylglycerol kinase (ATP)
MTPDRVAVLVNPVAGRGRPRAVGLRVVEVLRRRGLRPRLLMGRTAEDAADLVGSAAGSGIDTLVVCGGDGTISAALQAVAGGDVTLGVVPCGSGNDMARSWGLPVSSPAAALSVVLAGRSRTFDLARCGNRWFGAVLATGFDAKVNDRANDMRWPGGRLRYDVAMFAELASFRPLSYRLALDGRQIELDAMLVAVGNGPSYGGGMRICPDASLADGLLDVTVISRMSRARLVRLFPSVYSGRHVRQHDVLTFRAREVTVEAERLNGYADGELVGTLPLVCTAVPDAVRVFSPAG